MANIKSWRTPLIIIGIAILFAVFWNTGINDGQTFLAYRESSDINSVKYKWNAWDFPHNVSFQRTGEVPSLEEISAEVNKLRAGPDGKVGTDDDRFDLSVQIEILLLMLKEAYPHAIFSPYNHWIFNHAAGVLQQVRVLYTDFNEYMLVVGTPLPVGGFSGIYPFDIFDFVIDGEHRYYMLGEHKVKRNLPDGCMLSETENCSVYMGAVLRKDTQKGYLIPNGYMLEYGHGNIFQALYQGVIQPTLFVSDNWGGMFTTMSTYNYGIFWNSFNRVFGG